MLIARATSDDGGECLILGLSQGNIDRLVQGMPMRLTRKTHGDGVPEGWSIIILHGETEQTIADELRRVGAIGAQTRVEVDPRLSSHH